MKFSKIIKNISTVMFFSLLAKLFAFIIELLVATKFGASEETDVYYMVIGIVQICYPMISVGIWKVFLPEYKTRCVKGEYEEANIITNKLIEFFLLIFIFLTVFIFIYPQYIIKVFAPGFNSEHVRMAIELLRIVVFMFVFNCLATFSSAILQSTGQFSKSQVKEVIQYIPSIILLLAFSQQFGIKGLAYSFLTGAVLSALVELFLSRKDYQFKFSKHILDNQTKTIIKQVPIACVNSIVNQLNNIIDKAFSSILNTGAVTYLNYGSKLINLFDGIFSTAVTTAIFPLITEMFAKKEKNKINEFLNNYLFNIAAILLPISCLICLYSKNIVQLVFGYGKFNLIAVYSTSNVLLMYGLGLLGMCYTTIINDIFFILKKTKWLLYTTIVNIFLNVIFDVSLINNFDVSGLSLATTISLYISLLIKINLLRKEIGINCGFMKNVLKLMLVCFLSSGVSFFVNNYIVYSFNLGWICSAIIFLIVYCTILVLIIPDYRYILKNINKIIGKE